MKNNLKKYISCITLIIFSLVHMSSFIWAGSFEDALSEGNTLGQQGITTSTPGSINLQETVPQYNNAQGQTGSYTQYYSNPASMQPAAQGEVLDFTKGSYEVREKIDLTEDSTFGNKCLEKDEEGKCTMYSLSKDLITNTYPDCTKVLIPQYESSSFQTCTGSAQITPTPECNIRKYLYTDTENVSGPCESEAIEIRPNQIYAVCKDNIEIYRLNMGSVSAGAAEYKYVMAALCAVIGGCTYFYPTGYVVNSEDELPENATYLGQGVGDVYVTGGPGSRLGHGTWYKYYSVRQLSTIERVYLLTDSNCSEDNINTWMNECSIDDYAVCDSSGQNCIYLIQDSAETGNTANIVCQTHSSVIDMYITQNCTDTCSQPNYDNCKADCKLYTNCTNCNTCGSCSGGCSNCEGCETCDENGNNCTNCSSCTSCGTCEDDYQGCKSSCDTTYTSCTNTCQTNYNSCVTACGANQACKDACAVTRNNCNSTCGDNKTNCYTTCDTNKQNCNAICGGSLSCSSCTSCSVSYDNDCLDQCEISFCQESCSDVTVSGYTVCPPSNSYRCAMDCEDDTCRNNCQATYTDENKGMTLNNTVITPTPEYNTFTTTKNSITLTWQTVFGGPGVSENLNDWYVKIKFKCRDEQSSCQTLIDQGCVFYAQRCLDSACTQLEYTYKCGDDRITGYSVAYNCAGQIRCIGTDCKAVSYEANKDFAATATAGEILNMARVDSLHNAEDFNIFPGKIAKCQSSPENCCKPITGGLSIGDYVKAGYSAYTSLETAALGFNTVAQNYAANIVSIGNQIASKIGLTDVITSFSMTPDVAVTTVTESSFLGTTVTTTVDGAYSVAGTAVCPTGLISATGTIMTGVGLVLSAYSIATTVYDAVFACNQEDIETSTYLGYHLCHYVGSKSKKKFGFIAQRWKYYCCFNSILARIIHEQGRPQIGIGWGGGNDLNPNCRGFTTQELASLDFSKIDLTEYAQYISHKTNLSAQEMEMITNSVKVKLQTE